MSTTECHQELLLLFYFWTVVFVFTLDPWTIQSKVLGHISSVAGSAGYEFCLMEWVLRQFMLVDYSQKLCVTIALAYLTGRTLLQTKGFVVGLVQCCSFGSMQCPSCVGVKLNVGTIVTSLGSMNVQVLSSAMGSCYKFVESNLQSWLGIPIEPLWPTIQLDGTQSPYWKLHLVTRDSQLGL